jgi:hypothetical protein
MIRPSRSRWQREWLWPSHRRGAVSLLLLAAGVMVAGSRVLAQGGQSTEAGIGWKVAFGLAGRKASEVYLTKEADGVVRSACDDRTIQPTKPYLVVACKDHRLSVSVLTVAITPQFGTNDEAVVLVRADNEQQVYAQARASSPSLMGFRFAEPKQILETVLSHERMVLSFTAACSRAQELEFDLTGFSKVSQELKAHGCQE